MSLQQLARQIRQINVSGSLTPVLVTPAYLSLRTPFLVALAIELAKLRAETIRFDWYRGLPAALSFAGDWLAQFKAGQINRALASQLVPIGVPAALQITATISRPTNSTNQSVLGISTNKHPLPAWTTPVFLITSPSEQQDASPGQIFHLQSLKMLSAA